MGLLTCLLLNADHIHPMFLHITNGFKQFSSDEETRGWITVCLINLKMVLVISNISTLKANEIQEKNANAFPKETINIQHVIIKTFRILVKCMNMITLLHYELWMYST